MPVDLHDVPCGDITIRLGLAGSGPPLLFLGGTGWDLRLTPTPLQSPLTKHFTVALFDQRGQGQSDKPPGPYSMQGYAQDALAVVDHLGWRAPAVVGYSFGGMVAQEYAIRFPDRLSKLVLAATAPGGAGGSSFPVHELLGLPKYERARQGFLASDSRFKALEQDDPQRAADMIRKRAQTQTQFIDEPGAFTGLRAQLAARKLHNCYDRMDQITVPTLILAGESDLQAPMSAQHKMLTKLPRAVLKTVAGAHGFLFESSDGYDAITKFLKA
ncbi:hypothetical protein ACMU_05005 [Actibacterium mucosum KCTC 23349]|uniref:AB hydrolase-1 domain-containing protein n=1 Tax=Actibacterium mucosum KCTC 23349 TaxID=1454373 RepID=A0A037ZL94_9RHOB|nr:alpha/beta hydrolase [Actibacterium mucosum]KAJ56307.1 hypothetical protein ACMU_05005 [Actibacterium mucosum KCTC 23349]